MTTVLTHPQELLGGRIAAAHIDLSARQLGALLSPRAGYDDDTELDQPDENDSSDGSCYSTATGCPDDSSDGSCQSTASPIDCGVDTADPSCPPQSTDACPA